jgi:hypothetical protein
VTELSTSTDLGQTEARERCDRIKKMVTVVVEDVISLYEGRGWLALGYQSWAELCRVEFDGVQLAPPQRREAVTVYRDAGMSVRAIAAATGVAKSVISDDIQVSGSRTPDMFRPATAEEMGLFADTPDEEFDRAISTCHDENDLSAENVAAKLTTSATRATTGLDGKTYRRPVTAVPKTKTPLSDAMRDDVVRLKRTIAPLRRLRTDDRFTKFAPYFGRYLGDLDAAIVELTELRDAIEAARGES